MVWSGTNFCYESRSSLPVRTDSTLKTFHSFRKEANFICGGKLCGAKPDGNQFWSLYNSDGNLRSWIKHGCHSKFSVPIQQSLEDLEGDQHMCTHEASCQMSAEYQKLQLLISLIFMFLYAGNKKTGSGTPSPLLWPCFQTHFHRLLGILLVNTYIIHKEHKVEEAPGSISEDDLALMKRDCGLNIWGWGEGPNGADLSHWTFLLSSSLKSLSIILIKTYDKMLERVFC